MTLILGIESSCDETAACILQDGKTILGQFISSQIERHRPFGGVVPEVACREHTACLLPGLEETFAKAQIQPSQLDAIAVTYKPGLIGALLIGLSAAKSLALAWDKPLIGVDHVEAHIAASFLLTPEPTYPLIALVVSGGHSNLFYITSPTSQIIKLGSTKDDAAGEAFDKAARLLELGFPGGPAIQKAAEGGNPKAFPWKHACIPDSHGLNFSFSGIKTAVLHASRGVRGSPKTPLLLDAQGIKDAAASFQYAATYALTSRTILAAKEKKVSSIVIGGGVAANAELRSQLQIETKKLRIPLFLPPLKFCTDNAAMVARRGYELFSQSITSPLTLAAQAR